MSRTVKNVFLYLLLVPAAYLMLAFGLYVSSGVSHNSLSTNAFLFLTGLGGALVLLSPPLASRMRQRL
jgi:hypothetical protein